VIISDDDILCEEETLNRLIDAHASAPDRTYALHGRDPLEDNRYARRVDRVSVPTECDIHLTRLACIHRRFAIRYFEVVEETGFDPDPAAGGGEDILFSFVVRDLTGKRPVVLPGRYRDLLAPHAITSRDGGQWGNRTRIMRWCQDWLAGQLERRRSLQGVGPGESIDERPVPSS
jgi:hypothetical protein